MSKPFIKKPTFIEKGIYNPLSIPDILKDEIEGLAKAGEYGKLEQVFANYPTELSKSNNLLHSIIPKPSSINHLNKMGHFRLMSVLYFSFNSISSFAI